MSRTIRCGFKALRLFKIFALGALRDLVDTYVDIQWWIRTTDGPPGIGGGRARSARSVDPLRDAGVAEARLSAV